MQKFQRFSKICLKRDQFFFFSQFSDNPKKNSNSSNPQVRSDFDKFADSFFDVMKQNNKNSSSSKESDSYRYYSRTIYYNKVDPKIFKANTRYRFFGGILWSTISYATYFYIHPFVTLIPLWFASGSFLGYFIANNYAKKLVYKIDLSSDNQFLDLHVAKGNKAIKVNVEDMDLVDIAELKEKFKKEKEEKNDKFGNNFVIIFDAKDEKGKEINSLRLFFDQIHITVENLDLFKNVLLGKKEEVSKFKFVDEEERKKEEQEFDEKISEEFDRIKKESESESKESKENK